MKCLVLGATGFLGKNLIEKLILNGHEVRTYSLSKKFSTSNTIEHISGDFSKGENLKDALRDIDVVYHLISTSLPNLPFTKSLEDINGNLSSTVRLLNLMTEAGNKKIIFSSSGGTIYGDSPAVVIDESHPTNPICSYGISKLAIEKYINLFTLNSSISAVSLRISNPYGEYHRIGNKQGLINVLCHNISKGLPIEIWGDGDTVRDYLHVDDTTNALIASLQETGRNLTVNISSGIGFSINEVKQKILTISGASPSTLYHPARKYDVKYCVLSNALAKEKLGWEPTIDIDSGIENTYRSYLQSPGI